MGASCPFTNQLSVKVADQFSSLIYIFELIRTTNLLHRSQVSMLRLLRAVYNNNSLNSAKHVRRQRCFVLCQFVFRFNNTKRKNCMSMPEIEPLPSSTITLCYWYIAGRSGVKDIFNDWEKRPPFTPYAGTGRACLPLRPSPCACPKI